MMGIDISQSALEAMTDKAYAEGKVDGHREITDEVKLVLAQFRRLQEILEVEGDQNLVDAAEHMAAECRAHREATQAAAVIIERQRKEIQATKQYADEAHAALEPAQKRLHEQTQTINELRQTLLRHITETP